MLAGDPVGDRPAGRSSAVSSSLKPPGPPSRTTGRSAFASFVFRAIAAASVGTDALWQPGYESAAQMSVAVPFQENCVM